MEIKTKYDLKQLVYLVHDPEQLQRMITGIRLITPKQFIYELRCGGEETEHYEYELSVERNEPLVILKKQEE